MGSPCVKNRGEKESKGAYETITNVTLSNYLIFNEKNEITNLGEAEGVSTAATGRRSREENNFSKSLQQKVFWEFPRSLVCIWTAEAVLYAD